VKSLTGFFSVPKDEDDICMVYDASALGLNDALWALNFGLPDVDSLLSQVARYTYLADNDVGGNVSQFPTQPETAAICGFGFQTVFG